MSAPTVRRLVTAGSLSLALALATPVAAFAGPSDGKGENGSSKGKSSSSSSQGSSSRSSQGTSSSNGSSSGSKGAGAGKRSDDRKDERRDERRDRRRSTTDRAKTDPRGNNGTVKIDGEAFDDGRGNEPHVGCVFQVDFYGFDAGDTATITFTGQAPTGGGLLHSETATPISDDAAGGGQDRDATLTYSVSDQLRELLAIAPHAQQGWHVKLSVDVDSAPGGAKQKVFWIDCPTGTGVSGTTEDAATGSGTVTSQGAGGSTAAPTAGAGTTSLTAARTAGLALSGTTAAAASGAGTGAGAGAAAGADVAAVAGGAGEATLSARGAVRPSVLPFTGAEGLGYLLALGLSAVGVGTLAHRLGRRRAATPVG